MLGHRIISCSLFGLVIALATSCVGVAFDTLVNGNVTPTAASFDWAGQVNHPDSMTVLSARTEKELHYCFGYKYDSGLATGKSDTVSIVRGEYYSLSVGYDNDLFSIPSLQSFLSDNSYPVRSLVARPAQMLDGISQDITVMDFQRMIWKDMGYSTTLLDALGRHDSYWDDMTPYTPTIRSCGHLYVAENRSYMDPAKFTELSFSPKDITTEVAVNIPIAVRSGLGAEIVCAFACLSGIPSYVTLMSQLMERKDLGKVYMALSPNASGVYGGSIHSLGIFSPDLPTFVGGPGILYIYVLTSRMENGARIYRMSQPITKNLWSVLGSASSSLENNLMSRSSMSNQYYLKVSSYSITLPAITISKIVEGEVEFEWDDGGTFEGSDSKDPVFN